MRGFELFRHGVRQSHCTRKPDGEHGPSPHQGRARFGRQQLQGRQSGSLSLATTGVHVAAPELGVTGVVSPDVSRQVPVPSLATGRIVEIDTRLGDEVKKGQLLFKVRSTDIAGAYSDYRKAVKNEQLAVDNERLAKIQLDRAKLLFDDGAIPRARSKLRRTQKSARERPSIMRESISRPPPSISSSWVPIQTIPPGSWKFTLRFPA
jgi:hypothetical protein